MEEACDYRDTPIDLIIDRVVLQRGDDWSTKPQEQVERTTFLLAMVTNRYLTSEACREEFLQFRAKTEAAGYNGLLTLLVDGPSWSRPNLRDNPGEADQGPGLIELTEAIHTEHMPRLQHETDAAGIDWY